MATMIVRVELRGTPTAGTYTQLHAAMLKYGFVSRISGNDSKMYNLPHAVYTSNAYPNASDAARAANAAVATVWKDAIVLASGPDWSAFGLTPAN